eukprot:808709-Rhodomonas_salina.2
MSATSDSHISKWDTYPSPLWQACCNLVFLRVDILRLDVPDARLRELRGCEDNVLFRMFDPVRT